MGRPDFRARTAACIAFHRRKQASARSMAISAQDTALGFLGTADEGMLATQIPPREAAVASTPSRPSSGSSGAATATTATLRARRPTRPGARGGREIIMRLR